MLHKRYITALLALVLLSGCTMLKSLKKTEEHVYTQQANPTTSRAEVVETTSEAAKPTPPKREAKKEYKEEHPPLLIDRPQMQFSAVESANIRLSNYSPFPSSGEMVVDLREVSQEFCYPYRGKLISPYGMRGRSMHSGVDIKAIPNDTIRAAMPGVVRMAKPYSGYGNTIVIRHYNGLETVYGHQSKNLVEVNDVVEAGTPIGLAGRTGRATTEHLHFEVRVASVTINPTLLLDPAAHSLKEGNLHLYSIGGKIKASSSPMDKRTDLLALETNSSTRVDESEEGIPAATLTPAKKVTPATKSSAKTPAKSASKGTSSSSNYHTVKSGDTLSAISRRYSTTVAKLCSLNGISKNKVLQLKEKIRIK